MISAFGSGAAFSLISGMATGSKLQGAFTTGSLFALFQGVFYVVKSLTAQQEVSPALLPCQAIV